MSDTLVQIQKPALHILHHLQANGFEAYIVGGAVRDLIQGVSQESGHSFFDYDFTTNATPDQIQALFTESFYENEFGTVSVAFSHLQTQFGFTQQPDISSHTIHTTRPIRIIDLAHATKIHESLKIQDTSLNNLQNNQNSNLKNSMDQFIPVYEITTFRSDGAYQDHRRPESVSWGKTLTEDLSRRDFTCNAMALSISLPELEQLLTQDFWLVPVKKKSLLDPFDGQADLVNKQLKTVGIAADRFEEDALRMLRAIRFAVQLNFTLDESILSAIRAQAASIKHVSWERIQIEFIKMLSSNKPADAIRLLDSTGLLTYILPELLDAKGVEQSGHHTTDVWTHSLDALENCPSPDPIVRLATLLHDIAKPNTYQNNSGAITFYNHEIVGSRIAKRIALRLRLSKQDCDRIFTLVRYHMFHYQEHNTDAAIRRFMRKVGLEYIDDILDLREGDRLGSGARKTSWRLEEMKDRMIEQLHQPMEVKDLVLGGTELITQLGMKPGPHIGQILHTLFEEVLDNPELNTTEYLLARAQEIKSSLES